MTSPINQNNPNNHMNMTNLKHCEGSSPGPVVQTAKPLQHVHSLSRGAILVDLLKKRDLNTAFHFIFKSQVTHICVSKLIIIGSDNGFSPDRRQAIIWTNAGSLLTGPLGTNFTEILIEILTLSFNEMRFKVLSAKRRPFCLGLNVIYKVKPGFDIAVTKL